MKASSSAKKLSRAAARNAAFVNQLGTPGLGSLMARHWLAGTGQLLIFLTGFVLFLVWFIQPLHQLLALASGADAEDAPLPPSSHLWLVGLSLAGAAWCWSLVTSRQIMRAAAEAGPSASPPPVLTTASAAPGWQKNGEVISRTFSFRDFPAALQFVNAVGERAEQVQHHPDIDIRWNKVTLALTTHDAGRLTDKDYALALVCDDLYAKS